MYSSGAICCEDMIHIYSLKTYLHMRHSTFGHFCLVSSSGVILVRIWSIFITSNPIYTWRHSISDISQPLLILVMIFLARGESINLAPLPVASSAAVDTSLENNCFKDKSNFQGPRAVARVKYSVDCLETAPDWSISWQAAVNWSSSSYV